MKVNYLPKNRFRHPHFKRILVLVAIFVSGAVVFSFFDTAIISLISPVWRAENVVIRNLHNGLALFYSQQSLVAENAMLKEKLYTLETEMLALSMGRTQEDVLLELLGRKGKSAVVVAAVLTRPPQTPYDVIIIDAGSKESIAVGSQVSLPEGPILGIVSEVFPQSAKVKLFSTSGEEISATLERNSVPVTLIGTGGGNFRLTLPRDMAVERGDRILSPDIASHLLAVVGEVSVEPTDSFKEVLAKSPTNIFGLRFVFIRP